jgi:hypothetical protein
LCAEAANCLSRTVDLTPLAGVKAGSRAAFPAASAPHQCLHRLLSIPNLQLLENETRKAFSMSWKMQLNERVLAGSGNGESSLGTARGQRAALDPYPLRQFITKTFIKKVGETAVVAAQERNQAEVPLLFRRLCFSSDVHTVHQAEAFFFVLGVLKI